MTFDTFENSPLCCVFYVQGEKTVQNHFTYCT